MSAAATAVLRPVPMLHARTLQADHADAMTYLQGDLDTGASHCRVPSESDSTSLVFASDAAQLQQARERGAAIMVVQRGLAAQLAATEPAFGCCFAAGSIPLGMAAALRYFDHKHERFSQWGERHATAVVHPSAVLGSGVLLGPYCVIGAAAVIGDGCRIGTHVVIENGAQIGPGTTLHPHVFIGADCILGRDCEVHPHTSIGGDGFGYGVGASRRPRKISHLGNVRIGDEVEIGSNCAIDRATLTSTYIRSGAKVDNICHIAHNCDLGEDGFYTAGFMMAGSTTIGRRFMTGGNSVVSAHLTLADDVALAGRSTVTADITEPGHYGGYPLQPLKDAMRTLAALGQLTELRRQLNRVLRHLQLPENP
jgi:UDP-3-O-[3-hydroxymyristoyl] glucosamine N-acyltransferase